MEPFHKSAMDIGGCVDLKIAFCGHLEPFGASYDSQSPFRTQKIIPIYCLGYALTIQTLIDTDPPDWSHQIHLWSKGPFLAVLDPLGALWPWPNAMICSTLFPHFSTKLVPPDPLKAKKGRFWLHWTLWVPIDAHGWPPLTHKTVAKHHPGCALACSTTLPRHTQSG